MTPPAAPAAAAQPIDPSVPPPPPPAEPPEPVFDPLHANRSMNVGTFYLNSGKIDAAISRFLEASQYEPSMAKPWKMLGEAYEKKDDYSNAINSYKKYLDLLPEAGDAEKIRKRISDLSEKKEREASRENSH
ncbi:MAG: tetratricopeptide repeat protein [Candidatus Acidiferrales bacterium]